jgi:hypothetical protein
MSFSTARNSSESWFDSLGLRPLESYTLFSG